MWVKFLLSSNSSHARTHLFWNMEKKLCDLYFLSLKLGEPPLNVLARLGVWHYVSAGLRVAPGEGVIKKSRLASVLRRLFLILVDPFLHELQYIVCGSSSFFFANPIFIHTYIYLICIFFVRHSFTQIRCIEPFLSRLYICRLYTFLAYNM